LDLVDGYSGYMEIVALPGESVGGTSEGSACRAEPGRPIGEDCKAAPETLGPEGPFRQKGPTWQAELRLAVRDAAQLIAALELPAEFAAEARKAAGAFPIFAPWPYIIRMAKRDPADPLLRQVLPLREELDDQPGFAADPVGDGPAQIAAGLLHKYNSRALLVSTGACAIHCRYCFRRHYPYSESPRSPDDWQPAIERIAADPTIDEVILSGGDPLTLVDGHLSELAERIARVPHVRRLRIHTRLPIVIPQRVTAALLDWLGGMRLTPIMVVHANHPQEIDEPTAAALSRLVAAGIPILNQSVLLRGVNDNAPALVELSRRLVDLRVMPYYLHQLDRVSGAAHFEVPIHRGIELIDAMRRALPGYAVPRYVQEIAAEAHKRVLA
jgi:EF-P beta-lysylation protein EpmB